MIIFATRDELIKLRTEIRYAEHFDTWPDDWDTGGCYWVSEALHVEHGLDMDGGCFVEGDKHSAHYWNVLPDGTIFDLTCDTFGYDPFDFVPPNECYDRTCGCGKDG